MLYIKKLKYAFYICLGIIIVGCFLPYVTILNVSTNYVFYDGNVKDGIFIIILGILALIFISKNKFLGTLISQFISVGIFFLDYIDYKSKINNLGTYISSFSKFGVGFYIVLIGLIFSLVISIMLVINRRKNKVPEQLHSMNNSINQESITHSNLNDYAHNQNNMYCKNCGAVIEQNSLFCNNCGTKF